MEPKVMSTVAMLIGILIVFISLPQVKMIRTEVYQESLENI